MKLYLEDIMQDIYQKKVSKFVYNNNNYSLYEVLKHGTIDEYYYNLVDEDSTSCFKLKKFNSVKEALDSIGFKEEE
ncbi:MAG: hypothetical protein ACRCXT_24120 [Paraclostridium sp.]